MASFAVVGGASCCGKGLGVSTSTHQRPGCGRTPVEHLRAAEAIEAVLVMLPGMGRDERIARDFYMEHWREHRAKGVLEIDDRAVR